MLWTLISALLLICAFPQCDFWPLAWIGLVPLFIALDNKQSFKAKTYVSDVIASESEAIPKLIINKNFEIVRLRQILNVFDFGGISAKPRRISAGRRRTSAKKRPPRPAALTPHALFRKAKLSGRGGRKDTIRAIAKVLKAFLIAYTAGVIFFAGTLFWFIHVTLAGVIVIVLYLACYFGAFGIGYVFLNQRSLWQKLFFIPSFWVCLEYTRGHLLSGFGWVSLGHSQYQVLPLIQIADLTGFYGISFLVVMGNVILKEWFVVMLAKGGKAIFAPTLFVICLIVSVCGYGYYQLQKKPSGASIKITIVQANIAQELKWNPRAAPEIIKRYLTLTKKASLNHPDLIVWPETAFPGFIWESPELFENLKEFTARIKIPLLLGVIRQIGEDYYNSALLISAEGVVVEEYDKMHLVPFGEYIPLRNIFPFLTNIAPIGDFTAGKVYTLFKLSAPSNFSTLICFEDTVPELARESVRRGSNLLINLTNDAWFQDTKAPFMHMQAALFRAVENRTALIRATNTGVSCFIDPWGRVGTFVQNARGKKACVQGIATENVVINSQKTFYTKFGDVFAYFCFGAILVALIKKPGMILKRFCVNIRKKQHA